MTTDTTLPDIGRRLAAARLQRGLSQAAVSRRAKIAPSYLSRIERGRINPTLRTVARIASAIRVPLAEITGPGPLATGDLAICPVSPRGACLLDLIRSDTGGGDPMGSVETFTPRQIRLMRRFTAWVQAAPGEKMRAMEVLLADLFQAAGIPEESGIAREGPGVNRSARR